MPPPRRHLLLEGKESDGDKSEKVLLRLTLPGKCWSNPEHMQIQGCWGFRTDFRIGRKQLGGLLHWDHQNEPGVPGQEHDPDMKDQLRRHGHSRTRMLHPDYRSRDLSRWIRDNRDPEEDHGLYRRIGRTFRFSQHQGHPYSHSRAPDEVQRRVRRERAVQGTGPNPASWDALDLHLASSHDWNWSGPLPDWHADLEEMFQQNGLRRDNSPGPVGTSFAGFQPTSETHRDTGDQQSGHQIKCVNPYSYQHLMKKLPKKGEQGKGELEQYSKRHQRQILIRCQARKLFFCK
jgi:hypothetical protein